MFAKWKSKLKAAIKEAKDKRNRRNSKLTSSEALAEPVVTIEKQSDGLSRPYGLGGRKSVDLPAAAQGANNAGYPAAAMSGASLGAAAEQQDLQQHQPKGDPAALPPPPQQVDKQHANMMAQHHQKHQQHMHGHASGLRPLDSADRNMHGVDALMRSCPGSPVAPAPQPAAAGALQEACPAGHHASTAANGSSAGAPSTRQVDAGGAAASGQTSPDAAGLLPAGENSELGSSLGGVPTTQHRLDASRTPKDEELGSCPPYAAKAVWGLRYTMEDKWAAVPNLIQLPLVLTMPAKKSKGSKQSGCGCMIPAASKVLAKVSPSSRLGSGGSTGKNSNKPPSLHAPSPGLEKPSSDRQRLIGHGLSSSDEQGAAADAASGLSTAGVAAGDGSSEGGLGPLPGMDSLHYFGVFDGHGGADAARYCAQRMHQVVCNTILSMLSPEVAAAAVCSALATCSRPSNTDQPIDLLHDQRHQWHQQQPDEAAAPLSAGDVAHAASATSTSGSSAAAAAVAAPPAAVQPIPAIDIAASNGSWLLPALSRSFVTLDLEFGAISEGSYVGSTAVVVLVGGQRLWVAHAGDSRAVLGRTGALQVLTSDHKASRDDEVARVQAAGGHVWWDRVMGELAVSRAIGDHCLRPYVIPEPELLMVERTPDDEVLVMASDGLWDVMNNQEAVDMALHSLQAAQASGHVGVAAVKRSANALTKAALERGTRDNVTVLVINLRPCKAAGTFEAAASSSHHGSRHGSSSSRGHSSSKSSSSRSSKKAAAAAAAPAAAATLAAAGSAAGAAAASASLSGATVDSAAGVPTPAAAPTGAPQAPNAACGGSILAAVTAPGPADAAAVPAAGAGVATLPAAQPAAAAAVAAAAPVAEGAAQLSRAESGSAGETHSLIQAHESSSQGAGI